MTMWVLEQGGHIHAKTFHQILILTTPWRRARRDTLNQVLVHPIRSLDDKVMASGRSQDTTGWIVTQGGVGRREHVSNGPQTWSRASTLTQEPKGSPIHPIDPNGGSGKPRQVAQSNTSKDWSITRGRKFQLRPNFIPMCWRTVDEMNQLKTDVRCARGPSGDTKPRRLTPKFHQTASNFRTCKQA